MSGLIEQVDAARRAGDPSVLVALIPYAGLIGVRFELADGVPLFRLPYHEGNIGNPHLPALHGGVIGAFMENAAILDLLWRQDAGRLPKVVDFAIDYLRPGHPVEVFARCDIRRQGKRVANVGVTAWQLDEAGEERVIAVARSHFLVGEAGAGVGA